MEAPTNANSPGALSPAAAHAAPLTIIDAPPPRRSTAIAEQKHIDTRWSSGVAWIDAWSAAAAAASRFASRASRSACILRRCAARAAGARATPTMAARGALIHSASRREVQRGDAEIASCTMAAATAAAPMSRRVFTADTSLAASLYTGCATSHLASNATSMLRPPTVLLIGSQKSGSSSLRDLLHARGLCKPQSGELSFFNHPCFAARPVSAAEVTTVYLREWSRCQAALGTFDKSPATYAAPWAPLRVCEALPPRQRLLMLLRDPVARAYSGYGQCIKAHQFSPPALRHANRTHHRFDLSGFSAAVRLELAIVRGCQPWATGESEVDVARGKALAACCETVRGSGVFGGREVCATTPACRAGTTAQPHRQGQVHLGSTFGQWCSTHVRAGVYVKHLRLWYRYTRRDDILLVRSEDFFADPSGVADEVVARLVGREAAAVAAAVAAANPVGRVQAHATPAAGMEEGTRRLLEEFYRPYNRELYALVGRDLGWDRKAAPRSGRVFGGSAVARARARAG